MCENSKTSTMFVNEDLNWYPVPYSSVGEEFTELPLGVYTLTETPSGVVGFKPEDTPTPEKIYGHECGRLCDRAMLEHELSNSPVGVHIRGSSGTGKSTYVNQFILRCLEKGISSICIKNKIQISSILNTLRQLSTPHLITVDDANLLFPSGDLLPSSDEDLDYSEYSSQTDLRQMLDFKTNHIIVFTSSQHGIVSGLRNVVNMRYSVEPSLKVPTIIEYCNDVLKGHPHRQALIDAFAHTRYLTFGDLKRYAREVSITSLTPYECSEILPYKLSDVRTFYIKNSKGQVITQAFRFFPVDGTRVISFLMEQTEFSKAQMAVSAVLKDYTCPNPSVESTVNLPMSELIETVRNGLTTYTATCDGETYTFSPKLDGYEEKLDGSI